MSKQLKYSVTDKARILKRFMKNGDWFTSEKVRMFDATNSIKFNISAALSLLHQEGYLERKESRRIFWVGPRTPRGRRYKGLWAYRFKPEFLAENHKQLNINYEDSTREAS